MLAVLAVPLAVLAAGCTSSPPPPPAPPPRPVPSRSPATTPPAPISFLPAVGALFLPGQTVHYCTAAVVDSPSGSVVVTAAHCVIGTGAGLRFVPGYGRGGGGPEGSWTVTAAYAPPQWLRAQDPRRDYVFLTVQRATDTRAGTRGRPQTVEGAVGSVGSPGPPTTGRMVAVFGYNIGSKDRQVTCRAPLAMTSETPTVSCPGFLIGTSGAPWMLVPADRPSAGGLVGLVGGLQQGGCSTGISYSPVFDDETTQLMRRASAGGPGDRLPIPGPDGC